MTLTTGSASAPSAAPRAVSECIRHGKNQTTHRLVIAVTLAATVALHGSASGTVLTFDVDPPMSNGDAVNQSYGDRVSATNDPINNFLYGEQGEGFTPNVEVSYGGITEPLTNQSLWTTGYGDLTNVLAQPGGDLENKQLEVRLTADPGYEATLHSFDLAAFTSAFSSDPSVNYVRVLDGYDRELFREDDAIISQTNHTTIDFDEFFSGNKTYSAPIIRIQIHSPEPFDEDNNNIAIDNIRFSQEVIPASVHQIRPFATFDFDHVDSDFVVRFGYENSGNFVILGPGPDNYAEPGFPFQGQPVIFDPGLKPRIFSVPKTSDMDYVTWTVDGSSVTFDSALNFFYHYADELTINVSDSQGLDGEHSHANPNDGFTIGSGSELTGGAVQILSDGKLVLSGGLLEAHTLSIEPGGRMVHLGGSIGLGGTLENAGSTTFIDVEVDEPINNQAGSTVDIVGDVTFNALVSGPGEFFGSGTAHFEGGFSPGASPAAVPFEGSVALGAANVLTAELGGTTPGQFDRLEIAGDASLDGLLEVLLLDPFQMSFNQQFTILDVAGDLSGQFAGLDEGALVGSFGGKDLFITYAAGDGNDVALFTAVPEPATATMGLVAIAAMLVVAGRRLNTASRRL